MSNIKIKCPYCGAEYLPREIFLPKSLVGDGKTIFKNTFGKIEEYDGTNMDLNEEYICDYCGSHLSISTELTFNVKEKQVENFDSEYKTLI